MITRVALLLLALAVANGGVGAGEDSARLAARINSGWTQWRGPNRDSRIADPVAWPSTLSDQALRPLWTVELAPSYSGPVVAAEVVFVTETRDKAREVVRALERTSGRQLWEASWEGAMEVPFFAKANGDWIRATPAYDGESLFVAGMRDVLVCLDAGTGETRWRRDFVAELGTALPAFGFASSPLVDGDAVYVQAGAGCCKLEKRTGKIVWRTLVDEGGMMGSAFSSPVLVELAGRRQLLVQTREELAGVDPETGGVLWSRKIPAFRGMNILTPLVHGDTVFTSAYGGKSFLFRIISEAGKFRADPVWESKVTGYMSSPVLIDDHIYLHLRNRRFTCLDLATGESPWTTTPYGEYWSMVANGDRMLALDERGDLLLLRANPREFELLDSRKVSDEPAWAHLAVSGDEIFVRGLNHLTVYRWQSHAE